MRLVAIRGAAKSGSHGGLLAVADAASKGAAIVVALLIARYFGPGEYGQFALASSIAGMALLATSAGFEQELTRNASTHIAALPRELTRALLAILVFSVGSLAIAAILLWAMPVEGQVITYTMILWMALLAARLHLPFRHGMLVTSRLAQLALVQVLGTVAVAAFTVALLAVSSPLWIIIVSHLLVNLLLLGYWLRQIKPAYVRVSRSEMQGFVRRSIPFGLSSVIWVVYFNADLLMLGLFVSDEQIGLYGAAFRIVASVFVVGYAMSNAFTPRLFEAFEAGRVQARRRTVLEMQALLFSVGAAICLAIGYFGEELLFILVGPSFVEAATVVQWLAVAAFLRFNNFGLSEILTTSRRQSMRVRLECLMLLINLIANVILIPRFGIAGAAMASVLSEIVLTVSVGCALMFFRPKPAAAAKVRS